MENTSLLLKGFTDGGHETTFQVWFSSNARNYASIASCQHSCSIAYLFEGIEIDDKVAVKKKGGAKPYLSIGL